MQGWHGGLLLVVGLGVGFVAGWGLASRNGEIREINAVLRGRDEGTAAAKAKHDADFAAARDSRRKPREATGDRPPGEVPPDSRSPYEETKPGPAPKGESPEDRLTNARAKLRVARTDLQAALAAHDGEKAMDLLKQLSVIARDAPEARDDAMKLAVDINKDVQGSGDLHLSQFVYYEGLGDPAVRDLMLWSMDNQGASLPEFRVLSAWSIPWAMKPDDAIAKYEASLAHETDHNVQDAIVNNLSSMNTPKAEAVLAKVFGDTTRDASLRGDAAMALATSKDPAVQRAIEQAAQSDPEPRVQQAARVSLIVRDPPATGVLVTQTLPEGAAEAAGIRPGDVIVSYNGRPVPTGDDLRKEIGAAAGVETVAVQVVRDGRAQVISVKPGRLGLPNLRPVQKK